MVELESSLHAITEEDAVLQLEVEHERAHRPEGALYAGLEAVAAADVLKPDGVVGVHARGEGYACFEHSITKDGKILNPNFCDYRFPSAPAIANACTSGAGWFPQTAEGPRAGPRAREA